VLLAARIGVGIGEAALVPASASLISDIFPKHRLAFVFSIFSCGTLLGNAGALAIGGAVIGWAGDGLTFPVLGHLAAWQVAFVVTGAPGLLLAFLIFLVPEPKRPTGPEGRPRAHAPWSEVFRFIGETWLFLACLILGFACLLASVYGSLAWFPAILERTYGWSVGQVGATLGLFAAVMGLSGQLSNGLIVDRMMVKGVHDAHLRYYAFAAILVTGCAVAAPLASTGYIYLLILAPMKFLLNFAGVSSAALQVVTPSALRGRVTALMGIVTNVLGGSFGPSIVAFFTDQVFKDDSKVVYSLAATCAILVPLGGLLFAAGMKPMRRAIARQIARETAAQRPADDPI
jgi:MFS family permease